MNIKTFRCMKNLNKKRFKSKTVIFIIADKFKWHVSIKKQGLILG